MANLGDVWKEVKSIEELSKNVVKTLEQLSLKFGAQANNTSLPGELLTTLSQAKGSLYGALKKTETGLAYYENRAKAKKSILNEFQELMKKAHQGGIDEDVKEAILSMVGYKNPLVLAANEMRQSDATAKNNDQTTNEGTTPNNGPVPTKQSQQTKPNESRIVEASRSATPPPIPTKDTPEQKKPAETNGTPKTSERTPKQTPKQNENEKAESDASRLTSEESSSDTSSDEDFTNFERKAAKRAKKEEAKRARQAKQQKAKPQETTPKKSPVKSISKQTPSSKKRRAVTYETAVRGNGTQLKKPKRPPMFSFNGLQPVDPSTLSNHTDQPSAPAPRGSESRSEPDKQGEGQPPESPAKSAVESSMVAKASTETTEETQTKATEKTPSRTPEPTTADPEDETHALLVAAHAGAVKLAEYIWPFKEEVSFRDAFKRFDDMPVGAIPEECGSKTMNTKLLLSIFAFTLVWGIRNKRRLSPHTTNNYFVTKWKKLHLSHGLRLENLSRVEIADLDDSARGRESAPFVRETRKMRTVGEFYNHLKRYLN